MHSSHVLIWNALTGEIDRKIQLAELDINDYVAFLSATFSPDYEGRYVLTSGTDQTARIWDAGTGEMTKLMAHSALVYWAEFDGYGDRVITAFGPATWVWDADHRELEIAARTEDLVFRSIFSAVHGDTEEAIEMIREAQALSPSPEVTQIVDRGIDTMISKMRVRAARLAESGDIVGTLQTHADLVKLTSSSELRSGYWEHLCYYGAIWGRAKDVLDFCDRAVALEEGYSLIEAYDSRAIARALTGDFAGAEEDFEFYLENIGDSDQYAGEKEQRREWLQALREGENPFDEATLALLRSE
jgi:hypothetical protein